MTKQSITIIAGDYPARGHMMLVFVQQLVHAMIDQGANVNVVASQSLVHALIHREKLLPRHSKAVTENGVVYDVYRPYTLSFGNNNHFKDLADWFNRRSVESEVAKIGSDILYAHFWSSALPIYRFAAKRNIPLFVACGEGDNALELMNETMPERSKELLANSVTGVVSVSSENKRKCIDYGLSKAENIEVFPNCVNTDVFHRMDVGEFKKRLGIKDSDFVICFVGGFIKRKGPDRIAAAIRRLNDSDIKVMFIGKSFKSYDYDFDCPGIIHKGPLDHEQLPLYENCSDVFVLPTLNEGCCNAIVEALAIGLPVISSDGSFNDDILNEKNSIRVNPNDIDAIAEAIKKLKNDTALRRSMMDYSMARHEEYTIQGRAKRILAFINKQIRKQINKL